MNDNVDLLHYSYRTYNSYERMSAQKLSTIPQKRLSLRHDFDTNTTNTRATNHGLVHRSSRDQCTTNVEMTLKTTDDAHDNHR